MRLGSHNAAADDRVETMSARDDAGPGGTPRTAVPYGSWPSPLTAARVAAGALRLGQVAVDGADVYWLEGRAAEGGGNVLVRWSPDGPPADVSPRGFDVRTRAHEYGGGAYTVHDGVIYASNFVDQQIHTWRVGETPRALTPRGYCYAQYQVDAGRARLIAVREDHRREGVEPAAAIVAVPFDAPTPSAGDVLVCGADFYSDPVLSPDGRQLAWLQWRHPNMPWDGTDLYVADVGDDGSPGKPRHVAGAVDESVFQPRWSADGLLYFISDRTGWWNLYRLRDDRIESLCEREADFGRPQWVFGMSTYAFQSTTRLVVTWAELGRWRIGLLAVDTGRLAPLDIACEPLDSVVATPDAAYFIGGSAVDAAAITRFVFGTATLQVLKRSRDDALDPAFVSIAEPVTFESGGLSTHAFYYPPTNPACIAPAGTLPPLIVLSHGGPTSVTDAVLDIDIQFWTTRGFAVVDVNYGGSTGYGRAYRRRLNGQWGIVDVQAAVHAARFLVAAAKADSRRLITRGGSAGGYTTLAALAFHETFTAGASYYGVSDLELLARDTHKFEARYLDSLVGPYPAEAATYRARSPIHAVDRLNCALIFLQGLEDRVVPPSQSERMAAAVRAKGLPVAYVTFEGEQHGFRKADSIVCALESELYFYGRVFGFKPADSLAPVPIDNLPVTR
jgi:dipeptidyl aminopeptidase/acylaminoacyl peptidase